MKKLTCLLAMLASIAILGVPLSASADYENTDFVLNDGIRQEIADALDIEIASDGESGGSISAFSPEEEKEIGVPDFTAETYDLDSAIEVYGFNTRTLLSTKNLSEAYEIAINHPVYVVPFQSNTSIGRITCSPDKESGKLKVTDKFIPLQYDETTLLGFDISAIKETLSGVEDVSNLRLYRDNESSFRLVSFISNGTEYVIPYYSEEKFEGFSNYLEQGKIYSFEEVMNWLDDNIEPVVIPEGTYLFGGDGYNLKETKTASAPLWVGISSAVVAISTGTALFNRKKKTNE